MRPATDPATRLAKFSLSHPKRPEPLDDVPFRMSEAPSGDESEYRDTLASLHAFAPGTPRGHRPWGGVKWILPVSALVLVLAYVFL